MIASDTGWKVTTPFRCCTEGYRTVVFDKATPAAEIDAFIVKEQSITRGQSQSVGRLDTDPFTVKLHFFCDSGD